MTTKLSLGMLSLLLLAANTVISRQKISPPSQPISGPGGSTYAHARVMKSHYGTGEQEYWIYEPDAPRLRSAPLVIFLHGWGATNPATYGAWIEHLVRRGNIVVYPRYQATMMTPTKNFTPNAIAAVKNAIEKLQNEPGRTRPDMDKCAVAGHSVGGLLAANIAALAHGKSLPPMRAVFSAEPGRTWNRAEATNVLLEDLKKIPAKTLLIALAGDVDTFVKDTDAKRIYTESSQISATDKNFIVLRSDAHGQPALSATHAAPTAQNQEYDNGEKENKEGSKPGGLLRGRLKERVAGKGNQPSFASEVNTLDYYGTWKLFDGLCDAAFYGKNRAYALGDTSQQRFMGFWDDGVPAKELVVSIP